MSPSMYGMVAAQAVTEIVWFEMPFEHLGFTMPFNPYRRAFT